MTPRSTAVRRRSVAPERPDTDGTFRYALVSTADLRSKRAIWCAVAALLAGGAASSLAQESTHENWHCQWEEESEPARRSGRVYYSDVVVSRDNGNLEHLLVAQYRDFVEREFSSSGRGSVLCFRRRELTGKRRHEKYLVEVAEATEAEHRAANRLDPDDYVKSVEEGAELWVPFLDPVQVDWVPAQVRSRQAGSASAVCRAFGAIVFYSDIFHLEGPVSRRLNRDKAEELERGYLNHLRRLGHEVRAGSRGPLVACRIADAYTVGSSGLIVEMP